MEKCNGTNGDKNGTRKENRNNYYQIALIIETDVAREMATYSCP